jgi:hypothetical protein
MALAGGDRQSKTHKAIATSVNGVMFLGVPHDGSQLTAWGKLSYCTYWLGSSTELLEALQTGTSFLRDLNRDFINNYGNMRTVLVDFIELHRTKAFGLPLLVVCITPLSVHHGAMSDRLWGEGDRVSMLTRARIRGLTRIPLESDHISMNKFRAENGA